MGWGRWGGKWCRGAAGKSPFVAAIANNQQGYLIAMRLTKVKGFRSEDISRWKEKNLVSYGYVVLGGLP